MKQLRVLFFAVLMAALVPLVASPVVAHADVDVYTTPGYQVVNGREWFTSCEAYSQTYRCRTEIMATQVNQVGGKFVSKTGWVFNNLTYASSPRELWIGNPLAANGVVGYKVAWTTPDGRNWRTECDTDVTGKNGCRSYIEAKMIEAYRTPKGSTAHQWKTMWIFNNMVRFGVTTPMPTTVGIAKPAPVKPVPSKPAPVKPAPVKPAPVKPVPSQSFYKNCTEVRAAGKAPLRRGEPGYRAELDRDNDGIACDK